MLPIIDLSKITSSNINHNSKIIQEIISACEDTGFFYLSGHGVPQADMDAVFEVAREFFELPEDIKLASARQRGHYRGYVSTRPFSEHESGTGETPLFEGYALGEDTSPADPACAASQGLYWPNIWSCEPAEFKSVVSGYWDSMTDISQSLMRAFSLALGQPEALLTSKFEKPLSNMMLLHYLASSSRDDHGRAHCDVDVMTILLPGQVGGLQVLHRNGEWMDVEPLPGCFVVNLGNMMEVWSAGRFKSTMHRVLPPAGVERYSIAYFAHPSYDTLIKPLSGLSIDQMVADKPSEIHVGLGLTGHVAHFDDYDAARQ